MENLTPEQVVILVIFRIEQVREGNKITNINQSVPQEEIWGKGNLFSWKQGGNWRNKNWDPGRIISDWT